jgi:hypothetical protein
MNAGPLRESPIVGNPPRLAQDTPDALPATIDDPAK